MELSALNGMLPSNQCSGNPSRRKGRKSVHSVYIMASSVVFYGDFEFGSDWVAELLWLLLGSFSCVALFYSILMN